MLVERFTAELHAALPDPGSWRQWPSVRDRSAWERVLTDERRAWLIAQAEAACASGWPALPATVLLDCPRTGNRQRGESLYFARRHQLAVLTLAYAATRDPRWLDAALDALWSIAEESSWCIPAHSGYHPDLRAPALPRHDVIVVDLFAAETAAVVSDALDLLGEDLRDLDPAIVPRIVHELRTRVIAPLASDTEWWWLAGKNNWTPWIMANASRAVLAHAADRATMIRVLERFAAAGDRFLATYGEDGACDEGIRYWGVAFGTLFRFLDQLREASAGRIDLGADPRFAAMAAFPIHAHLGGRWFLPFADNLGTGGVRRALGWRIGERFGLPALQDLAWLDCRNFAPTQPAQPLQPGGNGSSLQDLLWQLFWMPVNAPRPVAPPAAPRTWLADLQVLVLRSPGLVMAVKGGHNGENHNHNDVGCVHVLKDNQPVVIDPGVEAYTLQTFSSTRYDLWCLRGSGHNAPVINGHEQAAGREHHARTVTTHSDGEREHFSADLAACYPAAASVRRALRSVVFFRDEQRIRISDEVSGDGPLVVTTNWYTTEDPRSGRFTLDFATAEVVITPVELTDDLLRRSWGTTTLWHITATVRGHGTVSTHLDIR